LQRLSLEPILGAVIAEISGSGLPKYPHNPIFMSMGAQAHVNLKTSKSGRSTRSR
jgi:hypothetical protein